jgi:hypothetical protein
MTAVLWPALAAIGGALVGALVATVKAIFVLRQIRGEERETRAAVERLTKVVAGSQAWFWMPEWQEGEREADEDIAAGHTVRFDSIDDMDAALDEAAKRYADSYAG